MPERRRSAQAADLRHLHSRQETLIAVLVIGIAGGGVGGLSAVIALRRQGHDVTVFEQAKGFSRVGADINLTLNVVRAIDGLGAGEAIRRLGTQPTYRISRDWDTGQETTRLGMAGEAEQRYGGAAGHHPPRRHHELLPIEQLRFEQRIRSLSQHGTGVTLQFEDGGSERFDLAVGADGIHSRVSTALFDEEHPRFTGVVSFRSVVPTGRMKQVPEIEAFTKWWGAPARRARS